MFIALNIYKARRFGCAEGRLNWYGAVVDSSDPRPKWWKLLLFVNELPGPLVVPPPFWMKLFELLKLLFPFPPSRLWLSCLAFAPAFNVLYHFSYFAMRSSCSSINKCIRDIWLTCILFKLKTCSLASSISRVIVASCVFSLVSSKEWSLETKENVSRDSNTFSTLLTLMRRRAVGMLLNQYFAVFATLQELSLS